MTRLTQEMRCKIAVWQKGNKSVRQTQRLYMEFEINLVPTRRTLSAIKGALNLNFFNLTKNRKKSCL